MIDGGTAPLGEGLICAYRAEPGAGLQPGRLISLRGPRLLAVEDLPAAMGEAQIPPRVTDIAYRVTDGASSVFYISLCQGVY